MCQDKKNSFSNVSLSWNIIADCVCELVPKLQEQLMEKGRVAYSLAVDEKGNITDTSQLKTFILEWTPI